MQLRRRVFFVLVVVFCLIVLKPFWFPMATGITLAYLCEGPVERLIERWRLTRPIWRWAVAVGMVAVVQGLFIVPLMLLTWSATKELLSFWEGMSGNESAVETGYKILSWMDMKITPLLQSTGFNLSFADMQGRLREFMQPMLRNIAGFLGSALSATPELLLFLFVTWMAWVYFLVYGKRQRQALLPRLIPWGEQRGMLASTLGDVLRAMVLASIVLSLVQSLMVVLTLAVFGVPKFYLWGALAFFLSFIPVFGTAPVMISAAIWSFYHDRVFAGIFILGMSIVIGLADNVLRPLLMKGSSSGATDMPFFWLFMSIVGGIAVFGVAGAVLGPWAFSLFIAVQSVPLIDIGSE
ncbi:MAG TPA: AI-2E family transporter [Oligoflexus sp.]|uniref:AI-2E family transporter n=1 Tax=Oligoflexus sp. TaxID=1971216 RepID=UPI002D7E72E0|nr:AI-2E family transporter [Oligoflexus sp.]HET9236809.1 AI-2E family transporter [Oligoflexus sp.]